jgi:hypothetical protein
MTETKTESEIEVTPAMIDAGERELCRYDDAFEGTDEAVVKIYRAMIAAKRPVGTP